ncbi:hypothetical protein N656DRAFT_708131, partial [Canariomyces notabilis]
MLPASLRRLLVGLCFVTCVGADAGDDFSNNLFSDLAPLLALFGERVTTQFMSQSMGWADNIVLAMAPLGVITAIVGAIRVGGPSWLKAIIGRARESRAVVEAELMSSTSNEVCELWNGQQIVRPGILERIFGSYYQKSQGSSQTKKRPTGVIVREVHQLTPSPRSDSAGRGSLLGKRVPNDQEDPEKALPNAKAQKVRSSSNSKKPDKDFDPELYKRPVAVIRNTDADTPNLTLNVHNQVGRGELYVVSICGIVLQLGVLVYSGLTAYHPNSMLLKDGNAVAGYAFPCTATGTLLLVAGIFICAHVVESSTSETRYRPWDGMEARVVWLQKHGTVNDQAFLSFAIFPETAQPLVTTSHRASERTILGFCKHFIMPALVVNVREAITVAGTMVSICGFVVQFIGLRGMHWSASVAQLGATIVMTSLRAAVRRNLAKNPKALPLVRDHELDWLAMTLGKPANAPWHPSVDGDSWDWIIAAVETPERREKLKPLRQSPGADSTRHPGGLDRPSKAQEVMTIRRDLGELAGWPGPASAEAIALARAIEVAMDVLIGPSSADKKLSWSLSAFKSPDVAGFESIAFRVEAQANGRWKIFSDELEAVLSLWLYFVHKQENSVESKEEEQNEIAKDDAWLRTKGTLAKPSLRLLGSHTAALYRDLRWWMPDGAARVIEVNEPETNDGIMEVESHRVVGFASNARANPSDVDIYQYKRKSPESPRRDAPLAVESYSSLKTLYSQHMFTAFIWSAAKTMGKPMKDGADVRPTEKDGVSGDSAWKSFTLHNAQLSKMVQDIQNTGLGSLEDVYLCVIPPLSMENRLPRADAIIEWAHIRGQTPLHYAACRQDGASIIHDLLRKGAEINIRDVDGIAPLHNAAIHGSSEAMRSLIEAGADIDAVDGLGYTPLHWAA